MCNSLVNVHVSLRQFILIFTEIVLEVKIYRRDSEIRTKLHPARNFSFQQCRSRAQIRAHLFLQAGRPTGHS